MYRAQDIARNCDYLTLLEAIAIQAVQSSREMLVDFLKDPAYVISQGLPTKETLVDGAVEFATSFFPQAYLDGGEAPTQSDKSVLEQAVISSIEQVIANDSDLVRITLDLR